jgi:exonuclease III
MCQLKIITANCMGWNDNNRRFQMFTQLSQMADILLLSETRCGSATTAHDWCQQFSSQGWMAFFSVSGTNHTGGTAVMFNKRAVGAIKQLTVLHNDLSQGRLTMVTGTWKGQHVCFTAIYSPADRAARPAFLQQLADSASPQGALIIAGGDLNCTLASDDMTGADRHLSMGRQELKEWVANWELQDAWHCAKRLAVGDEGYTKYTASGYGSRMDYVLVSRSHSDLLPYAATVPLAGTDHRGVLIKFGTKEHRGRWRLNASLLQQPHLRAVIAKSLDLRLNDVSEGRLSLGDAWVEFKSDAMGHCRAMAKAQKRRRKAAVKQARANVTAARTPETRAAAEAVLQQQTAFERQGELARKGVAAMSDDKPTREFFQRFARPSTKADIVALTPLQGEGKIEGSAQIMDELVRYWTGVYGSDLPPEQPTAEREAAIQRSLSRITAKLSSEQRRGLVEEYTSDELLAALRSLPRGSSPGNDGLSVSFYIIFWPIVGGILTWLLNAAMNGSHLPPSMLAARVILIAKTEAEAPKASAFRPISLLGTDYKIMAKAVTRRLLKVTPDLCHPTQTGFIPGRSILHNVSSNRDCIEYHRDKRSTAVIAFLDFEKAFDRVSWHFRDRVLKKMGFPPGVLTLLSVFYHNAPIQLEVNGLLSFVFFATRGSRQGCPLSPSLFCLYAEPLGALLRDLATGPVPTGIPTPPTRRVGVILRLGGCQYADDTTVYCATPEALIIVIQHLCGEFCTASGALLNIGKSSVLLLGIRAEAAVTHIAGIPVLGANDVTSSLGTDFAGGDNPMPPRITEIVVSLDKKLEWWRQHCPSAHGRARLANAMLSSKLWYHMLFEPVQPADLHKAANTVWRCIWGTGEKGKAKPGDVTRERACAPPDMGGLGVIEPTAMHAALKARVVNMALAGRGEWWTAFSEALVERAAGTGVGTGFDGLISLHDRPDITDRCTGFWKQALQHWSELKLADDATTRQGHGAGSLLLVQRALRSCPSEDRAAMEATVRGGKQYLSDFYDFRTGRLTRPERMLTSSVLVQSRNRATHRMLDSAPAAALSALANWNVPATGHLCRIRGKQTLVAVQGRAPAVQGPPCTCTHATKLVVRRLTNRYVVGPPVTKGDLSLWSDTVCACQLSPFLRHPVSNRWVGEDESTGLVAHRLCNQDANAKLKQNSTVSDLRAYFRKRQQPAGDSRPACETLATASSQEWSITWKVLAGSANLEGYTRTLVYRIMHRNLPVLERKNVQKLHNRPATCLLCGEAEETLTHLFADCRAIQRLWKLLRPLASALGMLDFVESTSRVAGLLGHLDTTRFNAGLPVAAQTAVTPKIRKVALQSWTEMRSLVLVETWRARNDMLYRRQSYATVALRAAEHKVKARLRYLVYLHLPYLSPWSLEPDLEAKQEKKLLHHVWAKLAPLILQPPTAAPAH